MRPRCNLDAGRAHRRALFGLLLLNAALGLLGAQRYVLAAHLDGMSLTFCFLELALAAQVWATMAVASLFLLVLSLAAPRLLVALAPLAFALLHLFFYVDARLFTLFHFHFNGLAWRVLFAPGGFQTMEIPVCELLQHAVLWGLVLAAEGACYLALLRRARTTAGSASPRWKPALAVVVALLAADRIAYAVADLADRREIMLVARAVPLYRPLPLGQLVRQIRDQDIAEEYRLIASGKLGAGLLNYPRAPLRFRPVEKPSSIVWIVLESWRRDGLDPQVSPNLWRFSERAMRFQRHYSGGNATSFGVFSLFYGLPGAYFDTFVAARRGPVLVERMRELGYSFAVFSTRSLAHPRFRESALTDIEPQVFDSFDGPTELRDEHVAERASQFILAQPRQRPFFLAVFLDSTHAPYTFPPPFARFRPFVESFQYGQVGDASQREAIFNRYRNAVAYVDDRVGQVLAALEEAGWMDSSVVLVTGDHGQEFNEHGTWFHNTLFDTEQLGVPLILKVPGVPPTARDDLTSHVDVVPTLLPLLGVENDAADYSVGTSLLSADRRSWAVGCGWHACAVIERDGSVTCFPTAEDEPDGLTFFDADYRPRGEGTPSPHLGAALAQLRAFVR